MGFEGARKYADSGPDRPKGKSIGTLRFLFSYLKPHKKNIAISVCAILVNSAIVLGLGSALKYLIDNGITEKSHEVLNSSFLFIAGMVMLLGLSSYTRIRLVTTIGENVIARLRSDLFSHVIKLSPTFFETNRSGEIISRIGTDTTLLQSVITSSVSFFLRNSIMAVGGTIMLAVTSPRLTGYVLFMIILVVLPIIVIGRRVRKLSRGTQDRIADLTVHVEESLSHIKIIQAFGMEKAEIGRFSGFTSAVLGAALSKNKMRAMLTASVITLIFGAITLILWFGGLQVIKGNISGGELSAFLFYSVVVASAVGALSELFADLQRAAGAMERMVELLCTKQFVTVKAVNPISFPTKITRGIEFRNVSFSYPTRPDKFALDHVDLLIPAGKTTALVGPSGAGKSTVIQLLLRFYDPSSGTITIDDEDIALFNLDSLRACMGLVPQEPFIFSSSALENIRYGKPDATKEEIIDAAKAAAAMEFIEKLPEGLNTYLGEKGVRLSGGQKQRIAIARAVLRNPKILLLDEATSSLDAENERLVQDALEKLMEGRTTVVIAHRLSTVRKSDQIVVLNNGIVESIGRHDELAEKNSTYANLSKLQFA